MKKNGFTLAEVLITLGIIGVVAAMTIPTLVNNYQKKEYVTQLEKVYAEFNQALVQMAADNGCVGDLKCTGFFISGDHTSAGDAITKYLKIVKNCGDFNVTGMTGCFPNSIADHYDGTSIGSGWDTWGYRFVNASGSSFRLNDYGCDNNTGQEYLTQTCAEIFIDVNGPKSPNVAGRDVFLFLITNGKGPLLYPNGGKYKSWYSNASGVLNSCYEGNKYGFSCGGRVIEEGWQMNY